MPSIERNPLMRCLFLAVGCAVLLATGASSTQARCAYVDVHFERHEGPSIAPGPLTGAPGRYDGRAFMAKDV